MTDRELLEQAAKVAGIEGYKFMIGAYAKSDAVGLHIRNYGTSNQRVWNPLTDDGDALRLAVELNIVIWECAQYDRAMAEVRYGAARGEYWEPVDDDKYAATRRAIVRAAAQIGKEIK